VRVGTAQSIPLCAEIRSGQGLAGTCLELKIPLRVEDPEHEPLLASRGLVRDDRISSALVIPLFDTEGDPLGVMCLSKESGEFTQESLDAAAVIAGHVALAVNNAMLVDQERKHGKELQEILESLPCKVAIIDPEGLVKIANGTQSESEGSQTWQLAFRDEPAVLKQAIGGWIRGELTINPVADLAAEREWTIAMSNLENGHRLLTIQESTDRYRSDRKASRLQNLAQIGQMTAAIAHEVRNPLAAIRGAAQLARSADGFVIEMSNLIENEVDKLTQLCDEFLEFARPLSLSLEQLELGPWATECVNRLRLGIDPSQPVQLIVSEPGVVMGDPRKLEQVLRNLVLNAIQASSGKSPVIVEVKSNSFSVADTGKGMDSETVEKLFTPFFTTRAAGTGLGLAITKKILDEHLAVIRVRSLVGAGSTFEVIFE